MTRIQIYDTTLRDGSQGEGINFSLQDKLLIAQRLDEMGFEYVEGGYPLSNEKDAQFFQRVQKLNIEEIEVLILADWPAHAAAIDVLHELLPRNRRDRSLVGRAIRLQERALIEPEARPM